jgi:hypothetical protein
MFNIGGDDKEKLKENMEEIRNLVNSESEQEDAEPAQESMDMPEQQGQPDIDQMQSGDQQNMNQAGSGVEQGAEASQQRSFSPADQSESTGRKGLAGQGNTDNSEPSSSQKSLSSRKDMKNHLESISNEVKKMEEGDRSSGDTLFLEVDEFNEVQSMVEEMKYLSREMKDLMNNLEDGIEEDRRVEGEAENVVEDFSERREKVQSALQ